MTLFYSNCKATAAVRTAQLASALRPLAAPSGAPGSVLPDATVSGFRQVIWMVGSSPESALRPQTLTTARGSRAAVRISSAKTSR